MYGIVSAYSYGCHHLDGCTPVNGSKSGDGANRIRVYAV